MLRHQQLRAERRALAAQFMAALIANPNRASVSFQEEASMAFERADVFLRVAERDLRARRLEKWPDEEAALVDGGFLAGPAPDEEEEP